jgi:hypothetical protein
MEFDENLKLEEYRSLAEEHRSNRSLIFERPLVILGLITIPIIYSYENAIGGLISAILMIILTFNLWFIGNRLSSDSRIVAYILLVHEGNFKKYWFGWENSLWEYRKWRANHKSDLKIIRKNIKKESSPETFRFYPPIWAFHVALVLFALYLSYNSAIALKESVAIVGFYISYITALIFLYFAFGDLFFKRLQIGIEIEVEIWRRIFEELKSLNLPE